MSIKDFGWPVASAMALLWIGAHWYWFVILALVWCIVFIVEWLAGWLGGFYRGAPAATAAAPTTPTANSTGTSTGARTVRGASAGTCRSNASPRKRRSKR